MSLLKNIIAFLYLCPLIFYYILPDTYELFFSVHIGFMTLFIPEISLFILLLLYKSRKIYRPFLFNFLMLSIFIMFVFSLASIGTVHNKHPLYSVIVVLRFTSVIFFSFYFYIKEEIMHYLKYIILGLFFTISFEILLFSFGILNWVIPLATGDFNGIMRINSTIGAASGTAMVYYLLSIWSADLFKLRRKVLCIIVVISFVVMMLTMTRSGILMLCMLYSIFLIRIVFNRYSGLLNKLKSLILIFIVILLSFIIVDKAGILISFQDRIENAQLLNEKYDTGYARISRYKTALHYIVNNPILGISSGHYHERFRYEFNDIGYGAPHNSYLLLMAEYGIITPMIFFSALFLIIFRMLKYLPDSIAVNGFIPFFLVGMNTESVIVENFAWYYLLFLMLGYYFWKSYNRDPRYFRVRRVKFL